MKEEINNIIEKEIDNIELNQDQTLNNQIEQKVQEQNKKRIIINLLKEANESGQSIDYNDNMTLEELEEKAREIIIED